MSRAGLVGVALLGGALGLAVFLFTRGLPDDARSAAQEAQAALAQAQGAVTAQQAELDEVVNQDKAFLEPQPEVAAGRAALVALAGKVSEVSARFDNDLKPLLDKDRHGDADRVRVLASELASAAATVTGELGQPVANARRLLGYKTNHDDLMKAARQTITEVELLTGDSTLSALVQAAGAQYPEAAPVLWQRMTNLGALSGAVTEARVKLDAALAAPPLDYVLTGRLADQITAGGQSLNQARSALTSDVGSLGKSIDRILVDMKEEEGVCYHKYRVVEGNLSQESGFQVVDCAFFREHEDHLGMALYSKPEGKLAEDAVQIASPPGYAYVGNPRYGQWRESNGSRFWEFYGQYALMRDLLWGVGTYRAVDESGYRSYRTSLSSRKPWFGGSNEFGTRGQITKTKYAGSTYYKAQAERARYSGSRFQETNRGRTGGGYQGSRFQGGNSTGVRSGGSRSSPVRRSSFGGGGK